MSTIEEKPQVYVDRNCPRVGLERLAQHCNVTMCKVDGAISYNEFKKAVSTIRADGLLIHPPTKIDKEILDTAGPQLKVIATHSVGLDHVDLNECKRRGIKVGFTPDVLTNAVAEMTISLTLLTARRLKEALAAVMNGTWGSTWANGMWMAGKQISGSTIGIIGLGRIGFAVAKRLHAFEPSKMLYCGNTPKACASEINAEFVPFKALLNDSDFVIATCAITDSTRQLFNANAFREMKSSAIFINVTRGALVDQDDLYDALTSGKIAAAGLDVTTPEPLPTDHKLLSLSNCTVTPHLGSATAETRNAMCELVVDNLLAGLHDKPLPSPAY